MARNFRELEAKMTPEARERVKAKAAELITKKDDGLWHAEDYDDEPRSHGNFGLDPQQQEAQAAQLHGITQEESDKRRKAMQRVIRLNQSEELQPTARLLALIDRYVSGEIEFEEWANTIHSWPGEH